MNNKYTGIIIICLTIVFMMMEQTISTASDIEKLTGMRFVQLARGGLLYDNWLAETRTEIKKSHPNYPTEGKQEGAATWRCKECHGWDYKGKDGAYAEGNHYTGIKGIRDYENRDPKEIVKILKDKIHAFGDLISENNYDALALFVSVGQVDMDIYINRRTKKGIGDVANGGRIYLATCTKCHGNDGKELNLGDDKKPLYIGTVANDNPWETLHNIRWGHPGEPMISLVFLELKEQLDVLAFSQALPKE